uniref:RNase H type-1 domain-containing protein n=1 Tax=Amphiprion ocellaris TaxID=80972 RepID=A0AAQ5X8A2_AMPOC
MSALTPVQGFTEFKKIKMLVTDREPSQPITDYLKDKWQLVKSATTNEEARRMWLSHEPYEWALYTDGSRKGPDSTAYWGFILKQGDKERYRQKGRTEGSAQAGEVTAVLEGLLEMEKRKVKRARIITDSSYCAQALNEDLAIWEENGFETAKGKTVAHRDLWKKIAELRMNMDLEVMHQKAHTKEGDHWKGNDEVDRFSAGSRPHCP